MDWMVENIRRAAQACFERGETAEYLYARAGKQEENGAEISADFTRAIAATVARMEGLRDGKVDQD